MGLNNHAQNLLRIFLVLGFFNFCQCIPLVTVILSDSTVLFPTGLLNGVGSEFQALASATDLSLISLTLGPASQTANAFLPASSSNIQTTIFSQATSTMENPATIQTTSVSPAGPWSIEVISLTDSTIIVQTSILPAVSPSKVGVIHPVDTPTTSQILKIMPSISSSSAEAAPPVDAPVTSKVSNKMPIVTPSAVEVALPVDTIAIQDSSPFPLSPSSIESTPSKDTPTSSFQQITGTQPVIISPPDTVTALAFASTSVPVIDGSVFSASGALHSFQPIPTDASPTAATTSEVEPSIKVVSSPIAGVLGNNIASESLLIIDPKASISAENLAVSWKKVIATPTATADQEVIVTASSLVTASMAAQGSGVVIQGKTLIQGGTVSFSGTEYILPTGGSVAIAEWRTASIVTFQGPVLPTITVKPDPSSAIVVGGHTLLPGSTLTVSGNIYVLPSGAAAPVVTYKGGEVATEVRTHAVANPTATPKSSGNSRKDNAIFPVLLLLCFWPFFNFLFDLGMAV